MRRGFTLIEVLTTIVIFGILISITGYVYGVSLARSRDNQRLVDVATIKNTLEQYYLDERSYPHNSYYANQSQPWIAKYELERYKTDTCDNLDPTKLKYLAPNYITSLPEDPRYQLVLDSSCDIASNTALPVTGYGQYLYASLVADSNDTKPKEYYLMARLERTTHVSKTVPTVESRYAFSAGQIDFSGQGAGWDYTYCAKDSIGDPTEAGCSYNYYVKNSNND
ncbi:MAG: type II secretion system protein [Patescibacteria group bacterium]